MMQNEFSSNLSNRTARGVSRKLPTAGKRKTQPSDVGGHERQLLVAERLEAARRLTAWIAHQINNPLGAISGNAQLLARRLHRDIEDTVVLKEYLRYIGSILDQAERCASITSEMMNFTRPGDPRIQPVDLQEVISEAKELVAYARPDGQVIFEVCDERAVPRARADREWLSRVLFELLSNAVESAGVSPVIISAGADSRQKQSKVRIEVKDFGTGIAEDDLPRIFDPFFSTRLNARGLGLTLALEMVKKMGGDIRVVKSDSSGSTFAVTVSAWGSED